MNKYRWITTGWNQYNQPKDTGIVDIETGEILGEIQQVGMDIWYIPDVGKKFQGLKFAMNRLETWLCIFPRDDTHE
jgi:hypothetical protein